jgi:hypothetical protein
MATVTHSALELHSLATAADPPPRTMSQEDRIRAALGITHGALPKVENGWLHRYYQHLRAQLSLPLAARYTGDLGPLRRLPEQVTVLALIDPAEQPEHEEYGIACRCCGAGQETVSLDLADLAVDESAAGYQLLEDYWYWFWNWRFDPQI